MSPSAHFTASGILGYFIHSLHSEFGLLLLFSNSSSHASCFVSNFLYCNEVMLSSLSDDVIRLLSLFFSFQWLKLSSEDVKEQIFKLAKKGLTPSQIGKELFH